MDGYPLEHHPVDGAE